MRAKKFHTSLSGNNLKFPLMFLIFSCRNMTSHKSQSLFFRTFLSQLRLPFLLLTDLFGGSLVLRQYRLFDLILIYFLV